MVKEKANSIRMYDAEGYRRRAACICVKSDLEDEVSQLADGSHLYLCRHAVVARAMLVPVSFTSLSKSRAFIRSLIDLDLFRRGRQMSRAPLFFSHEVSHMFHELLQVLLVTSSRRPDSWIVPGGGVEPEEEPAVTALREVREEAGVLGQLGRYLGTFEVITRDVCHTDIML